MCSITGAACRSRARVAHGLDPGVEQQGVAVPVDRLLGLGQAGDDLAVGLVAHLDQLGHQALAVQLDQGVVGEGVQRLGLVRRRQLGPGLGGDLLVAVGPVVGIVEVEQHLHAGLLGALDAALDVGEVGILGPVRIVPDADPRDVGAGRLEELVLVDAWPPDL
jgi:hypothetical protein